MVAHVIDLMKSDQTIQVRDTAAWTIGRICEQVPTTVLQTEMLINLLTALDDGLQREARVATNVCWVIFILLSCWVNCLFRLFHHCLRLHMNMLSMLVQVIL